MGDSHVGLSKCFYCGGPGTIVLATRYRQGLNGQMHPTVNVKEKVHNKVIDMTPCQSCQAYMNQGVILISVRDGEPEKEKHKEHPDPYRTGRFSVLRLASAQRMLPEGHPALKCRWCYVEDAAWARMGLPLGDEDHSLEADIKPSWPWARCKQCNNWRQVSPTWFEKPNHTEIRARCVKCHPDETDREFTMETHVLELYASKPETIKS